MNSLPYEKQHDDYAKSAEELYEKYKEYIHGAQEVYERRHARPFNKFDAYVVGKLIETFLSQDEEVLRKLKTRFGRIYEWLPHAISASYATSIMPVFSSTQPITPEENEIYYKQKEPGDLPNTQRWITQKSLASYKPLPIGEFNNISPDLLNRSPMATEIMYDLVQEINAEVSVPAIRLIKDACKTEVLWCITPRPEESSFEHRLAFIDAIEQASTIIADTAGRGCVNFMITSGQKSDVNSGIGLLFSLSEFTNIESHSAMGPQVFGTFNDTILIIKVPTGIIPTNEIYCGYRGFNWFEAIMVHSPYLWITMEEGSSELLHLSGIKLVNSDFLTKITLQP